MSEAKTRKGKKQDKQDHRSAGVPPAVSEAKSVLEKRSRIEWAIICVSLLILAESVFLAGVFVGYEAGFTDYYANKITQKFDFSGGPPRSAWTVFVKWYVIQAILMSVLSILVWRRIQLFWAKLMIVLLMSLPLYQLISEKWEMITIRGAGDIWLAKPTIVLDILAVVAALLLILGLMIVRFGPQSEQER
ncbi:MAG TPA: hypothetical protein VMM38_10375 [Aridibacter sp.]|nr:hypothetical protein [Aridibacter sp.]